MKRITLASVALPMALSLLTASAVGQETERQTQQQNARQQAQRQAAQQREAQRDDRQTTPRPQRSNDGGSTLTLRGPDGNEAVQVTKTAPDEVRAGERFEYQIQVQNLSDSPLMNVVVVEQLAGLRINEAAPAQQNARQNEQNEKESENARQRRNTRENAEQEQNQEEQSEQGQEENSNEQAQQNRQAQQRDQANQQNQNQQNAQERQQSQENAVQQTGNEVRYRVGKLDAGQSRTLNVSATASSAGEAHSCMWVDYQPTLCTTIAVVEPDFRLTGRLLYQREGEARNVEGIYSCDTLRLQVAVTGTGDVETEPAQVTVQLPEGLTTEDGKNEVSIDMGAISPDRTIEKEVPLKLDPAKAQGELELPITATAGDLRAQASVTGVRVLQPELELQVNAPKEALIDQQVSVPVTVSNPGDTPVLQAAVDVAATGIERFQARGAELSRDGQVTLGRIEPGESKEFQILFTADEPVETELTVAARGFCVEAQETKAQMALKGIPAILIEVVDKVDPVPVGEATVYEVTLKNQGTATDTNIQLTAELADTMEFVRGDGQTEVTNEGKNVEFASLDALEPGEVVSWTVQVKATGAEKSRFRVNLESDSTDEPILEEEPTTLFEQDRGEGQTQTSESNEESANRQNDDNQSNQSDSSDNEE